MYCQINAYIHLYQKIKRGLSTLYSTLVQYIQAFYLSNYITISESSGHSVHMLKNEGN